MEVMECMEVETGDMEVKMWFMKLETSVMESEVALEESTGVTTLR